jgi:ferritin-like protein
MNFKDKSLSGILRSLAADEFLAWMQYYFAEIISHGKALNFANKIFEKNAEDELDDHYNKLVTWMQSKNIAVPTDFSEMQTICNTQYKNFTDPTSSDKLVANQITAENEAIDAYTQAMNEPAVLKYPDLVVMLGEICNDEREHLKELEDVRSQIVSKSNFSERTSNLFK